MPSLWQRNLRLDRAARLNERSQNHSGAIRLWVWRGHLDRGGVVGSEANEKPKAGPSFDNACTFGVGGMRVRRLLPIVLPNGYSVKSFGNAGELEEAREIDMSTGQPSAAVFSARG